MQAVRKFLLNALMGEEYDPTQRKFKYALVRGQFAILVMVVPVFYTILDVTHGVYQFVPWYSFMMGMGLVIAILNRARYYAVATILLLIVINTLIYLFADVDNPEGGVYFYLMTCSIAGLILGGYYSTRLGFFFALLPVVLGYLAYTYESHIMPPPSYDPVMIRINFISNLVIGILSNIFVVYFLISQNRESEASLRASEQHLIKIADEISLKNTQLAKTNEELDRFVYSASHDMRAPLSSLMGLIHLCERATDQNELKTYLDLMKGRIHTMDGFIREITDYSRNSRLGLTFEKIQLDELITETVQSLSYLDIHKKVRVAILSNCQVSMRTDINRFKVILSNLLANAYRYHKYNQEDPLIEISTEKKNNALHITVRDNGQGIPAEHQQNIFDMFYRASEISEGSGLGLYIVKETLEKLGGSIRVESTLGVGSAFTFTIPA
jgi:signal transduction histidine kinase